jgi:hypothetical protein
MCRDIVAHLFRLSKLRMEPPNVSHKMARIHQERLLERHHLLPHKMARVPGRDEIKGTSNQDGLGDDVTPGYVAEAVR